MTRALGLLLVISVFFNLYFYQKLSSPVIKAQQNKEINISSITLPRTATSVDDEPAVAALKSNERPSLLSDAQGAFKQNDFYAAVDLLQDLEQENSNEAEWLKYEWLKELRMLIERQQYQSAHLFLDALLNFYPYDPMFMPVRAELLQKSGEVHEAIKVYYALLPTAMDAVQSATWLQIARDLSVNYIEQFKARADWQNLLYFIDDVERDDPEFKTYAVTKVQAFIALQQFDDARFELKALAHDPSLSHYVKELEAQLLLNQNERKAISLTQSANHYYVPAVVNSTDDLLLMIDTGASLTVISRDVFSRLNSEYEFTFVRDMQMNTAGGLALAQVYEARIFAIDEFEIKNLLVAVMPLSLSHNADGVLGMNFLKYFQFEIDQPHNRLWLKPDFVLP